MKFYLFFTPVLFLAFLFIGCQNDMMPTEMQSESIESATDEASESFDKHGHGHGWQRANDRLEEKFLSAIINKDLDKLMSCFWKSPDLVLVLENGWVVRGWDNVRGGVEQMFAANETLDLVVNWQDRFRVGETVYAVGNATWTRTAYDGTVTQFDEVWTDARQKVRGKWVIVMNHPHDLTPFPPQPPLP